MQNVYLAKSADNHTWFPKSPYLTANNLVSLVINVTKAPLNDPAVRKAISFGIDRQQLSAQGETGYELPETSTSGLLLPAASSFLMPSLANNLPSGGDCGQGQLDPHRGRLGQVRREVDQERQDDQRSRSPTRSRTPTTTSTPRTSPSS